MLRHSLTVFLREFRYPPPVNHSENLTSTADEAGRSRQTLSILGALLLLCLIPRALMAWQLGAVCDDGYYYMSIADSLGQGDFDTAFQYLHLNVYPVILLISHRLGLDWIVAGKLWGVLVSSLVVLPLFGWVRRLFDRRTAAAAGFLYAVHPDLIEWSVEPLRDSTFWFLFTFCLYLMGRAISERKFRWFLGTGLGLALAIHTRIEGWILLLPLTVWTANRWRLARIGRLKLVSGMLLALTVTPCLLVTVNMTLLRGHSRWDWGRLKPFRVCLKYGEEYLHAISLHGNEGTSNITQKTSLVPSGSKAAIREQSDKTASVFLGLAIAPDPLTGQPPVLSKWLYRWVQTRQPVNLLLLIIGLIGGRRLLRDPERLVLIIVSVAITVGLGISLITRGGGPSPGRYFLMNVLVLVPFTAVGFQFAISRLFQWGERRRQIRPILVSPAIVFVLLLTVVYWGDALSSRHTTREQQADLGRWLQSEFEPFSSVVADGGSLRVGYYAGGDVPVTLCQPHELGLHIRNAAPDLVIIHKPFFSENLQDEVAEEIHRLGLHQVSIEQLFPKLTGFCVYVRRSPRMFAEKSGASGTVTN